MQEVTAQGERQRPRATRTCAGCRQKAPAAELLRFAVRSEPPYVAPDPARRLGGRGVSVHPRWACVRAAVERGGFARASRRPVGLTAEAIAGAAAEQCRRRAEGLLLSAHRAGAVAVGTDAVRQDMERGRVRLLVVAEDAANRREALEAQAQRLGGTCVVMGTKESLGRLLGRAGVAVASVSEPKLAAELVRAVARAKALEDNSAEVR